MTSKTGGVFVPIVGPSGVGKDSVIAYAANRLAEDENTVFVRRTVTRPTSAGGEDFLGVTEDLFGRMVSDGAFCLHWSAHDLRYGIPVTAQEQVTQGKIVVANLSRAMIDVAREVFVQVQPIAITAPRSVVAHRLRQRGREDEASILRRLARLDAWQTSSQHMMSIDNSEDLATAGEALVQALLALKR